MAKTLTVFKKINLLRERYYKTAVKKEALLQIINETEVGEQVYNSNAIENSTLTLEETELLRFFGETEGGVTLNRHCSSSANACRLPIRKFKLVPSRRVKREQPCQKYMTRQMMCLGQSL